MIEGQRIKAGLRGNKVGVGFKQNRPHKTHHAYARQSRRPKGKDLRGASHKGWRRDPLATTQLKLETQKGRKVKFKDKRLEVKHNRGEQNGDRKKV